MGRQENEPSVVQVRQVERPGVLYEQILLEPGMLVKVVQYRKSTELCQYYLMTEDGQEIDNFVAEKKKMDPFLSPQVIFTE